MDKYELHLGDCLLVLPTMPENSVDAVLTDPPYGLTSDGKKGFMGHVWDKGVPGVEFWKEILRVAKPGAHMLAFGGCRTYHRLACAIEDAGWEIRECIMWVFSQGFPKSMNISKMIDKMGGGEGMSQNDRINFAKELRACRETKGITRTEMALWFPQYTEVTKNWERVDDGFRVPNEIDYDLLVTRLGITKSWKLKVKAEDKRRMFSEDKADRRQDGTVFGLGHSGKEWEATTALAKQWEGFGTSLKPAYEPILLCRKPLVGTVVQNVLQYGTGGINIDACRVPTEETVTNHSRSADAAVSKGKYGDSQEQETHQTDGQKRGRFPSNFIHDNSEEVVSLFPNSKTNRIEKPSNCSVDGNTSFEAMRGNRPARGYNGEGSAARFFYCAKASKKDRDENLEGFEEKNCGMMEDDNYDIKTGSGNSRDTKRKNTHPTVKPTSLCRYLCKMICPKNGIILDPFMGSGSTGKAAMLEGFKFIGIELEKDYMEIAKARIEAAAKEPEVEPEPEMDWIK